MKTIFRGIILSNHSQKIKIYLLERTVLKAAKEPDKCEGSPKMCHEIFEAVLDSMGRTTQNLNLVLGELVMEEWITHHDHMSEYLTPEVFEKYMNDDACINKSAVLKIVCTCLKYEHARSWTRRDLEPFRKLLRAKTLDFLKWDDNLNVATQLVGFWADFDNKFYLFVNNVALVKALIHRIANCRYPNEQTQTTILRANVGIISNFIGILWANFVDDQMKDVLLEIYTILSSWKQDKIPSPCMASLVPFIPRTFLDEMAKQLAITSASHADKKQLLCRVIDWLCCPFNKNVDIVIYNLMTAFEGIQNYTVLIAVAQAKAEQMLIQLKFPLLREATLSVLLYTLLSYQHSADLFHKIIPHVPSLLKCLRKENSESSLTTLSQIVCVVHVLMQFHSGFPDIYDPLLIELKDYQSSSLDEMREFMSKHKWISTNVNYASSLQLNKPAKSITGKIGLVNLGNTCYVNSVLQALYMNDELRCYVLSAYPSHYQILMNELQKTFAFLSHSQRPAYSAKGFLIAATPDWFEQGRQQDCSEFLRHFFDKMHEQECIQESTPSASSSDPSSLSSSSYLKSKLQCDSSAAPNNSSDKESNLIPCLIHQLFGGQLTISYECLNCRRVSVQSERFIDLSLALPKCHSESKYIQRRELKAGRPENLNLSMLDEEPTRPEPSITAEPITVPLVVGEPEADLKLEELIQHYISPEKLEGENRYHCDNCNELQEAQKSISITDAPKYLTLTLLRFAYDIETHQRIKILKNILYPEILSIPVTAPCNKRPGDPENDFLPPQQYSLYAVVVHSGLSSDCGHYYTYACHSNMPADSLTSEDQNPRSPRSWYLFNDSRVLYSDFKSLSNLTQRFAKDTAYLLFYRKIEPEEELKAKPSTSEMNLRQELWEEVNQDNIKYLQELEEENRTAKISVTKRKPDWGDFDDQNPPGGLGGGYDGMGPLGSLSVRFVC